MSSSNDSRSISNSRYSHSKNRHSTYNTSEYYHHNSRYNSKDRYRDYSRDRSKDKDRDRDRSRNKRRKRSRSRSRSREKSRKRSKYRERSGERKDRRSHSRRDREKIKSEKSNSNIIINKPSVNNVKEEKTQEEILLERRKRKAKAQLLIMLDNEEKLRNEENKYKEKEKEEEEQIELENNQDKLNLKEKVNNNLSNDINEIGVDPLDVFMEDLTKNHNVVKQIENFDNPFDNKNTITLEEIQEREKEENGNENGEEKNEKEKNEKEKNENGNNGINDNEEEDDDSSYHENFMNVINNALNIDNKNKKKEENSTAVVMYDEDHFEYKNNLSQANGIDNIWKMMKNNIDKEKDLKIVDHSKMNYDYFTKNLYIESPEIAKLTPEEVIEIRKTNGSILVKGKEIPKPILDFYQCGLSSKIMEVLEFKQIKKPFPIQMQAIPAIMSGRDCLGVSETGSGKTLAYVLPMLRHVQSRIAGIKLNNGGKNNINYKTKEVNGPIALILVPTRELATQICEEIRIFTNVLNIETTCLFGGSNLGNQINDLKRGVDIAVATPARLIELLCLSNGKITNLTRTTFVVIDEADRMFDL